MSAQTTISKKRQHQVVYDVRTLPRDFKRILRVQFKEFLHYLDESSDDHPVLHPLPQENIA